MKLHSLVFVFAVISTTAAGRRYPVMDWSLSYGYCKAASPMHRRAELEPIFGARLDDVVEIHYATDGDMSGHDVYRYPDEASWSVCDQSQAVAVTTDPLAGGGCANSSDFRCFYASSGVEIAVDTAAVAAGGLFLACSGMHCTGGLKLRVLTSNTLLPGNTSPPRDSVVRDIVVPAWTDDFGYCDGLYDEVHRPHGLESLWAYEGDTLVFKFSARHNVWRASTRAVVSACDFSDPGWVEIADTSAGGGCQSDDSLGPYGRSDVPADQLGPAYAWAHDDCLRVARGFRYPLSLDDPAANALRDWEGGGWTGDGSSGATEDYARNAATSGAVALHFACQIHDHCVNGQRLSVYVLPRPPSSSEESASSSGSTTAAAALAVLVVLLLCAVGYQAWRLRSAGDARKHVELKDVHMDAEISSI